jgi:hypothetical protein
VARLPIIPKRITQHRGAAIVALLDADPSYSFLIVPKGNVGQNHTALAIPMDPRDLSFWFNLDDEQLIPIDMGCNADIEQLDVHARDFVDAYMMETLCAAPLAVTRNMCSALHRLEYNQKYK